MAKFVICSVHDDAVKTFNTPMFFRSKDEARRSFGDAVADAKSDFSRHAGDYSLWCFGEWDDIGQFNPQPQECLMQAIDVVKKA